MKCVNEIGLVNFFECQVVHYNPPVAAGDYKTVSPLCGKWSILFINILNNSFQKNISIMNTAMLWKL